MYTLDHRLLGSEIQGHRPLLKEPPLLNSSGRHICVTGLTYTYVRLSLRLRLLTSINAALYCFLGKARFVFRQCAKKMRQYECDFIERKKVGIPRDG